MSFYTDDCKTGAEAIERAKATRRLFASLRAPVPPAPPVVALPPSLPPPPPPPPVPPVIKVEAPLPINPGLGLGVFPGVDRVPLAAVIEATCQYFERSREELFSSSRGKRIVLARHICIYAAMETTQLSMAEISRQLMKGDHSTIIHVRNKIKDLLGSHAVITEAAQKITTTLRSAFPDAKPPPKRLPPRVRQIEGCPNSGKDYSEKELEYIRRRWVEDGAIAAAIAHELGRTVHAISRKLEQLRLNKTTKALSLVNCVFCKQPFQQRASAHSYCSSACQRQQRKLRDKGLPT